MSCCALRYIPLIWVLAALLVCAVVQAQPRMVVFNLEEHNAFTTAAEQLGVSLQAQSDPSPDDFDALLICAPDYPQVTEPSAEMLQAMERFLAAGKGVYVEYTPLPGLLGEEPWVAGFERLVVMDDWAVEGGLFPLKVLEEHQSRHLPLLADPQQVLLTAAKVAGLDRAVFGLPEETHPALVAMVHETGRLLVATTALSNSLRGRYRPSRAWEQLSREILQALMPPEHAQTLRQSYIDAEAWTEPRQWAASGDPVRLQVRTAPGDQVSAYGPGGNVPLQLQNGEYVSEPLVFPDGTHELTVLIERGDNRRDIVLPLEVSPREERYLQTVERNLRWFEQARMLIADDGSQGVREGLRSEITPTGMPQPATALRVDCVSESALYFHLYGILTDNTVWRERGERMLQYTARAFQVTSQDCWYFGHWQSRGEFREDGSTIYVFNDDSGAATLFSLFGYAATGNPDLLQVGLRGVEYFCSVASNETGLPWPMRHRDYLDSGRMGSPWPRLRVQKLDHSSPHVMNLPLASLLVAYQLTGEQRYFDTAQKGIRTLMELYPEWHVQTSQTCEHGRMLLPLALLHRIAPSDEHRQWLDMMVDFLLEKQAPCGAMTEWDGYNPKSNADFGTAENSVFQENGDPISDQLYGTGFALLHLGLAYQVTGDDRIRQGYEKLGDYLTRIQLHDSEPLYDGTWLRAFDYERWEYFGSSADIGWGPYCSETGWMCAPIGLGLLLSVPLAESQPWDGFLALPDRPDPALQPLAAAARAEAQAVENALSGPPPAITDVEVEAGRGTYALLSWNTPDVRAFTYNIYRSTDADFILSEENLVGTSMEGHWADPQLVPHTQYHYRISAVNGLGEAGEPSEIISITTGPISMARGRPYTKSIQPHPTYSDIGESASTDGFYAGPYRDRRSYGYRLEKVGDELAVAVTVDLENVATISRVISHNCGGAGYSPDTLHVSVSTDGENWTAVGGADFISANLLSAGFPEIKARYVRFEFTKQRSGNNDDWLFLDELEVF